MQVSLIDFTGACAPDPARYAAERMIFTKQTRLQMDAGTLAKVEAMTEAEVQAELEYMANTIPSSWEFCSYTFLINGVSRAFTHQFVRTRTGSYAQQTMRVLDMEGWDYVVGPTVDDTPERKALYEQGMKDIDDTYRLLIAMGAKIEDARGILPTNICTNIVAKFDLRTLADTFRKRASSRTQGEYREVIEKMKAAVLAVHPFAAMFFDRTFERAAADLEAMIKQSILPGSTQTDMIKLLDQMRMTV